MRVYDLRCHRKSFWNAWIFFSGQRHDPCPTPLVTGTHIHILLHSLATAYCSVFLNCLFVQVISFNVNATFSRDLGCLPFESQEKSHKVQWRFKISKNHRKLFVWLDEHFYLPKAQRVSLRYVTKFILLWREAINRRRRWSQSGCNYSPVMHHIPQNNVEWTQNWCTLCLPCLWLLSVLDVTEYLGSHAIRHQQSC